MTYYNDKLSLVVDSLDNTSLFMISNRNILKHYFDKELNAMNKEIIVEGVFLEYSTSIDKNDNIYLVYQDMSFNLILTQLKGRKLEKTILSDKPISELYYLELIINEKPHIFYYKSLKESKKQYGIYHSYFNGKDWVISIVDKINVNQLLNPMRIIKKEKEIILAYYDKIEDEQIYIKSFNISTEQWERKIQLTSSKNSKLYIDILLKDEKLNLVYSEFQRGNLIIKYERFNYINNKVVKEKEHKLSKLENPQEGTLIYYDKKLWVVWIEYDNVMSRYSEDNGETWSSIYLWKESKREDIVKYNFSRENKKDENILNHSFGRINPAIKLIGFGDLEGVTKIE